EQYRYTLNEDFLRNTAYPVMKKAAEFFLHLLAEDEAGRLTFTPSTSPENSFRYEGRKACIAKNATMSAAVIQDLFESLTQCFAILGIDDAFAGAIRTALLRLTPFRIGSQGQLLEWDAEYEESEPHHRHCSHLYALHPARLIDPASTPELAKACRRTLELRGDDGTGWSLAWKINFWARLWDGDRALRLLEMQLRPAGAHGGGTYPNLFDAHPPFQIDGNFGAVSGINEMLLQAQGNTLRLLPALPAKWKHGSVKGLAAHGNRRVDIAWKDGNVTDYRVSGNQEELTVVLPQRRP
ncbi:MAG: glycoside hydrolase family 95 protein, partial [Oscillospiraceae bacterium]|nr:glycoside hydrolase family 95 protein [Oscillospiraceae bacterium]